MPTCYSDFVEHVESANLMVPLMVATYKLQISPFASEFSPAQAAFSKHVLTHPASTVSPRIIFLRPKGECRVGFKLIRKSVTNTPPFMASPL